MKTRLFALAALFCACLHAQNIQRAVLANTVSSTSATQIYIYSAVIPSSLSQGYVYLDSEAVQVTQAAFAQSAVNNLVVLTVKRGILSTSAATHTAGIPVFYGFTYQFIQSDLSGGCNSSGPQYINVSDQMLFSCGPNTLWVGITTALNGNGGGGGSPGPAPTPTAAGCTFGAVTGTSAGGTFAVASGTSCAVTLTLPAAGTANYLCAPLQDNTSGAVSAQASSTTSTAVFKSMTVAVADSLQYSCGGGGSGGGGGGSGTVTSITANTPLTGGTITSSGNIGIQQASASQAGYVSAADYSLFTGKAPLNSPTFTGTVTLPAGQIVNGVTLTTSGSSTVFLNGAGSYSTPSGSGGTATAIQNGLLSARPTCATNGQIYQATDQPDGQQEYNCSNFGGTFHWVQKLNIDASGLTIVGGTLGIGSLIPCITCANAFSANQSEALGAKWSGTHGTVTQTSGWAAIASGTSGAIATSSIATLGTPGAAGDWVQIENMNCTGILRYSVVVGTSITITDAVSESCSVHWEIHHDN